MKSNNLSQKRCIPCEVGGQPLSTKEFASLLAQLDGWQVFDDKKIAKEYKFKDFVRALEFVNAVGQISESEGHHPDIFLHGFNKVKIMLSTHALGGLSENDFIVAAKIDEIINGK